MDHVGFMDQAGFEFLVEHFLFSQCFSATVQLFHLDEHDVEVVACLHQSLFTLAVDVIIVSGKAVATSAGVSLCDNSCLPISLFFALLFHW